MGVLGCGPRHSRVDVTETEVVVRLGWSFRAKIPRATITDVAPYDGRVWAWGAHGWRGRWLVNGSSRGIVVLTIDPPASARVVGWPIRLRELAVSVEDRDSLLAHMGQHPAAR